VPADRASEAERAYLARVAAQSRALEDERPPASLAEMFDRLDAIRRAHGALAQPGIPAEDESELRSHLRLYERWRELQRRGAIGARRAR
jgi:hypothetical protein